MNQADALTWSVLLLFFLSELNAAGLMWMAARPRSATYSLAGSFQLARQLGGPVAGWSFQVTRAAEGGLVPAPETMIRFITMAAMTKSTQLLAMLEATAVN
ncbi:hypothetical protein WJX74_008631 [Apatococcus lobatus]|uniref:Uncharacterized protein n=1 Tax=Apatococcus lobatus TaxID=904363 RepID=A0AAW1QMB2_9CHLO